VSTTRRASACGSRTLRASGMTNGLLFPYTLAVGSQRDQVVQRVERVGWSRAAGEPPPELVGPSSPTTSTAAEAISYNGTRIWYISPRSTAFA